MKEKRRRYLHNTAITEARSRFLDRNWPAQPGETVAVPQAVGRVTAEAVFANISSPHYHAAAMDGVAVRAMDTVGASETAPKKLRLGERAHPVDTGNALPEGCDAVIMAEDLTEYGDEVEIIASVAPWQHVRPIGEDIVATEMLLPAGHRLSGVDAGALLAGGVTEVTVHKKARVTVIPTGNELVMPGTTPKPGQIIEYNSTVFSSLVEEWGGQAVRHEIVRDDFAKIKEAVARAARQSDIVLINAGSSAGRRDYTADVVAALGEVLVHGVAVRPGKPSILGVVDGKPVIGVPGYPVSAIVALELFLKPLLYRLQGQAVPLRPKLEALFSRQITSALSAEEWVRVKVGRVGSRYVATPLPRGSGVITSLVRADGIVRIAQEKEGLKAGEPVDVELLRTLDNIDRTVVCIGSHDLTLDILGDILSRRYPGYSLSSAHVGSTGGIMALRRGEAHLAGVHLLDEKTGEYNLPFLKQFLPDVPVVLVTLIEREQGLMVAPGNPKGIHTIADLTRPDVAFINRQRGAGTRLLLDARLKEEGILPEAINGYGREEYNHLAVAAAVAAGSADTGLGVLAAAKALGLDFIPLARERYDLAIPQEHYNEDKMEKLLEVARSDEFKQAVNKLGGYHTERTGSVVRKGE
ncbi:MAG: molybdopterin biosynthesis protein [Bacillota bacterium]|nr:molybdopterin biosynthesis protein [Bacillota bacterium]MDW7682802.1 molybdopterin biosynthesis protein [Bacillota bacterium]